MAVATLSDLVFHIREVSGGRPDLLTIREHGRRQALSTADFLRGVHSLALALEARDLGAGERVAIFFDNRPEWHIVDFACQLVGAVTVPIPPTLSPTQVGFILRNSASSRVFYGDADQRDVLLGLAPSLTSPPEIVAVDGDVMAPGGTSITRLMGHGATLLGEVPIERFRGRASARDMASLVYVEGQSGEPRGVEVSHQDAVSNLAACGEAFELSAGDAVVSALPLADAAQRTIDHCGFHRGARLSYVSATSEASEALLRERPVLVAAGPEVYQGVYRRALERFPAERPWRRRVFRWAIETGRRYAAARGGFVSPLLGIQRHLADALVHRKSRQLLGGRLRQAVCEQPLAAELAGFFAALGIAIANSGELLDDGLWASDRAD